MPPISFLQTRADPGIPPPRRLQFLIILLIIRFSIEWLDTRRPDDFLFLTLHPVDIIPGFDDLVAAGKMQWHLSAKGGKGARCVGEIFCGEGVELFGVGALGFYGGVVSFGFGFYGAYRGG